LFALPLIFGLIGLFYHFKKNAKAMRLLQACCSIVPGSPSLFISTSQACSRVNVTMLMPVPFMHLLSGSGLAVLYFIDLASQWDKCACKKYSYQRRYFFALLGLLCMSAGLGATGGFAGAMGVFIVYALVAAGLPYAEIFSRQKNIIAAVHFLFVCLANGATGMG
jgi:hypothetical protein